MMKKMKQFIKKDVLGVHPELSIERDEYVSLLNARDLLTEAYSFEEKYSLIMGNYAELEKTVLGFVVNRIIEYPTQYKYMHDVRSTLQRRILNLLTATKLYRDQVATHISIMAGSGSGGQEEAKKRISEQYDQNPEFRFMEAFRNHVQHVSIQLDNLNLGAELMESENQEMEYYLSCSVLKQTLAENRKFKSSVLKEIPDEVSLIFYIRKYIKCIGAIHEYGRNTSNHKLISSRAIIQQKLEEYCDFADCTDLGVYLYSVDGETTEKHALTLQTDDVRLELKKMHPYKPRLADSYATGKVRESKIS